MKRVLKGITDCVIYLLVMAVLFALPMGFFWLLFHFVDVEAVAYALLGIVFIGASCAFLAWALKAY